MIMDFNTKKRGFTLSEVLLTLALIGTLATMTLSTVGSSIQQRARLSEFRTAYAKMDAALRSITLEDGKIYSCYFKPTANEVSDFGLTIKGTITETSTECETLMKTFARAMGATRFCETDAVSEGCLPANYPTGPEGFEDYTKSHAYVLDNSMLIFDDNGMYLRQFAIDVNGRKGPNKWGQDIFPFSVKATESKVVFGNTFVTELSFLPAVVQTSYDSKVSKTTLEMIHESAGQK
ncbi:MAG: type II secretion system protein [Candidatus Gastranaerophilaceae bacterium]